MQDIWGRPQSSYKLIEVFKSILSDLAGGFARIDTVDFLDRITPAFARFDYAVTPKTLNIKGENVFLWPKGMDSHGNMEYRIAQLRLGMLKMYDLDLLRIQHQMDYAYSHKDKTYTHLDMRLRQIIDNFSFDKKGTKRVEDIGFLLDKDIHQYQDLDTLCMAGANAMMGALADVVVGRAPNIKRYLKNAITRALQEYAQSLEPEHIALVTEFYDQLEPEILSVLDQVPSARKVDTYNWLSDTTLKDPKAIEWRRDLAKACPIMLLWEDEQARHVTSSWYKGFPSLDKYMGQDIDTVIGQFFSTDDAMRISFYKSLREHHVPEEVAYKLPELAKLLEANHPFAPDPQTPDEWRVFMGLARGAGRMAPLLGRERTLHKVFYDVARNNFPYYGGDVLARHFAQNTRQRLQDVALWRMRTVIVPLTLKLISEGHVAGIDIPVREAFYMAAQKDAPYQNNSKIRQRLKVRTIQGVFDGQKLCDVAIDGVDTLKILETSHDFATHRGQIEQDLQNLIISRRVDEHAQAVRFAKLPIIRLDFHTISPIQDHGQLNQLSRLARSNIAYEGIDAIMGRAHFVAISNTKGHELAIAKLIEPKSIFEPWQVERVEAIHTQHTNLPDLNMVLDGYFAHEDFAAKVNLANLQAHRTFMYHQLAGQAQDRDMTLADANNFQEKAALLERYRPYILTKEPWEVDDLGCISTPHIDRAVRKMITRIKPFYMQYTTGT